MYLPLGSSMLLRFLQLPSLLSNSEQPEQLPRPHCRGDLNNLGNISPYHNAPPFRVYADLPDDCTVDQVILLHRHGSRGPVGEQKSILQLVDTLSSEKGWDAIQRAHLPPYLEFLKDGYKYDLVPEELTVTGRKELFDHGVEFSLRYPTFSTDDVISTTVPRVIDSAHFFSQGFFGRDADKIRYLTTANFSDPVSWLVPWEACPKLSNPELFKPAKQWADSYLPHITDRLNTFVPGVGFTVNDTHGALYACPYDLAARGVSPWCDVFTAPELGDLEYEIDVLFDTYTGHASRGDPGPLAGAFYVKKLIERLTDTNAKSLYLDFAHDVTILFALSALGLNKDAEPLSPLVHRPPPYRKFRTSYQTPFAANMVWEKFTCKQSFEPETPQVRLVLNGETYPLSLCKQTKKQKKYGTCSLEEFMKANEYSMNVEYHNKAWNDTCGP